MDAEIKVAAKWWADQVRNGAKQDNGEVETSNFISMLADKLSKPTDEQITVFEQSLIEGFEKQKKFFITVYVDYHPEGVLAEACEKAQINRLHIPIKTRMYIKPGSVRVRNGYGAETVELFINDE